MCSRFVLLWFVFSFVLCWRYLNIFYFTNTLFILIFSFIFVLVDNCVRRYVFKVKMTRKTGGHGVHSNWYET